MNSRKETGKLMAMNRHSSMNSKILLTKENNVRMRPATTQEKYEEVQQSSLNKEGETNKEMNYSQ